MKHTKIVCTIGPASSSRAVLRDMLRQGMNAARINTAHGDFEQYLRIIKTIRSLSEIPVILDIKGPELRLRIKEERVVRAGETVEIGFNAKHPIYFSANCQSDIHVADRILIQDGLIECIVIGKGKHTLHVRFPRDAVLKPNKNVVVPGRHLHIPSLSPKDMQSVRFARKHKVEYIALSYTRNVLDVARLRKLLGKSGIGIICKIENQEGIDNVDTILDFADGIMVARGDMGVELPLQRVPLVQKEIIRKCNLRGKLVITATQMLDSMIENPRPTRAEASDVANAILDGSDAVMLSGETATGKHPIEAVRVMADIAKEVERHIPPVVNDRHKNVSDAVTKSIFEITRAIHVDTIVSITFSGYTARMLSRFRANKRIIAVTPNPMVRRQLELYYAVNPVLMEIPAHHKVQTVAARLLNMGMLRHDDVVVFTAGIHTMRPHTSNLLEIHTLSELIKYSRTHFKKL